MSSKCYLAYPSRRIDACRSRSKARVIHPNVSTVHPTRSLSQDWYSSGQDRVGRSFCTSFKSSRIRRPATTHPFEDRDCGIHLCSYIQRSFILILHGRGHHRICLLRSMCCGRHFSVVASMGSLNRAHMDRPLCEVEACILRRWVRSAL